MKRYEKRLSTTSIDENYGRYYENNTPPVIEEMDDDIVMYSRRGMRFDTLAYDYYQDETLWWMIASANPEGFDGSVWIVPATKIRIPKRSVIVENIYTKQLGK